MVLLLVLLWFRYGATAGAAVTAGPENRTSEGEVANPSAGAIPRNKAATLVWLLLHISCCH